MPLMFPKIFEFRRPKFPRELFKHKPQPTFVESQNDSGALQADGLSQGEGHGNARTGSSYYTVKGQIQGMPPSQPVGMASSLDELSKVVQQGNSSAPPDMAEAAAAIAQANATLSRIQSPQAGGRVLSVSGNVTPMLHGTSSAVEFWKPLWEKVEMFASLVEGFGDIHPYAKMASKLLLCAVKPVLAQNARDKAMLDLQQTICDVYDFVNEALRRLENPENFQKEVLLRMSQQVIECAYFIRDESNDENFYIRATKNVLIGEQIEETMKGFIKTFKNLKRAFMEKGVLETQITTFCVFKKVDQINAKITLQDLTDTPEWGMLPNSKGCLPGTRIHTLESLSHWINQYNLSTSDSNPRVHFVVGGAGVGKSAIAHGIGKHFQELGRLASFFRFDRSIKGDIQINSIFKAIAKQLSGWNPCFRLKLEPGSVAKMDIESQWRQLILEPAQHLQEDIVGPVLIVIDALDECGTSRSRRQILSFLTKHSCCLPPNFRVIVTSRPEQDIMHAIRENVQLVEVLDLQHQQDEARKDVDLYIREWLKEYEEEFGQLTELEYNALSTMADGLFQWAFTACKFMIEDLREGLTLRQRFKKLCAMNPSGLQGLDSLYSSILKEKFMSNDSEVMARFHFVMAEVLGAAEPLSFTSLHKLHHYINNSLPEHIWCCSKDDSVNGIKLILKAMGSLLIGALEDETLIKPFHTSFRDFLTKKDRGKEWYINLDLVRPFMALGCFRIMNDCLHFNICQLSSSFLSNDEMVSMNEDMHRISLPLKYACQFWGFHLTNMLDKDLYQEIASFVEQKLLFWFEVLSILHSFKVAGPALVTLNTALKNTQKQDMNGITALVHDAVKFAKYFAPAIMHSAPHIYLSALIFAPKESVLANTYGPRYKKTFILQTGQLSFWPVQQAVLRGHIHPVESVAFSPNGKYIVSGSEDYTVQLWDAETGQSMGKPLIGHTNGVKSVAFSSNGKHVVSGSSDGTLRIWDVEISQSIGNPLGGHTDGVTSVTFSPNGKWIVSGSSDFTLQFWNAEIGQSIGKPLKGHTRGVTSVAFSPDGKYIVSGSDDGTLCIWDIETGQSTGKSLKGHTDRVTSVSFSPDGKHIVSGSNDWTVQLWNAETGQSVGKSLNGHTGYVRSVAFSPNGEYIVSGSTDGTLRVWNIETGQSIGKPLEGHTYCVTSVAFSPDGKHIVSGSDDCTIRLWDATTEYSVIKPLKGHTGWIRSVAFSPDGKYIVSGSSDGTLQLWDIETGQATGELLEGHTDGVTSVAFSPNGKHIVSGSHDCTVQLWNAETGQPMAKPFKGHTNWVRSVAFSPDGKHIVSGSSDCTLQVWDVKTGKSIGNPLKGHTGWIRSVAFSPDGKCIVSCSHDLTVRLWDLKTGQSIGKPFKGHTDWIRSVAFSPNGKYIVSGSIDCTLQVWDVETCQSIGKPLKGHTRGVTSVVFSPDGKHIVSGSSDCTLQVWDVETQKPIGNPLKGHKHWIRSVAFSPDGKYIVSGSHDLTVRLWDAMTDHSAVKLLEEHTEEVTSIIYSHNRKHIKSPSDIATTSGQKTQLNHNSIVKPLNVSTSLKLFFNEHALVSDDGWIYGPDHQLLLWVPPLHRQCLFPMCLHYKAAVNVFGSYPTHVHVCNGAWGTEWNLIYDSSMVIPLILSKCLQLIGVLFTFQKAYMTLP